MLLRFGVSNYLSFSSRQELSLVATSLKDNEAGLLRIEGAGNRARALPVALMYGPNASGKSNLVAALRFMAAAVDQSHRSGNPEGGVPRHAFALSDELAKSPSSFDIDFIVDGVRYHYGFKCDDTAFLSEWLYAFPQGTRRKIFDRTGPAEIEFGPSLKGPKAIFKSVMRPNSLFLSVATQNNHVELGKIAAYFSSIQFNGDIAVEPPAIIMAFAKNDVDTRAIRLLESLGTGVVGVEKKKNKVSPEARKFSREVLALFSKFSGQDIADDDDDDEQTEIKLVHRGMDGRGVPFDLARESSGTRRLLVLITSALAAMDRGQLVVIDELDASLHTHAAEVLMALFLNPEINVHGSQLIATTHDTNLMLAECLRRDEIWFVEKDSSGASEIYPLAEYQTRSTDNIERGYMQGRFGAVPYSGSAVEWLKLNNVTANPRP